MILSLRYRSVTPKDLGLVLVMFDSMSCDRRKSLIIFYMKSYLNWVQGLIKGQTNLSSGIKT